MLVKKPDLALPGLLAYTHNYDCTSKAACGAGERGGEGDGGVVLLLVDMAVLLVTSPVTVITDLVSQHVS